MLLGEVPTAWADEQRGDLIVQPVVLAVRTREFNRPVDGIGQVDVTLRQVGPGRRVRVLEVRHETASAGVERVDDHLAVRGAGYLDSSIESVGREWRDCPIARAHVL